QPVGIIIHNGQHGVACTAQRAGGIRAVNRGVEEAKVHRAVAINQLVVLKQDGEGLGSDVAGVPGERVGDGGKVCAGAGGAVGGRGLDGEGALAATGAFDGDDRRARVFVGTVGGGAEIQA